ncbi:hypothetical protein ATI61_10944 [Archangium gephyra]|uniref:Lipoprotein n=1 Tax=Archangium gephyra TaxID=48 RepID=A0AAC8TCU6_9BACT|nr:hypothetical protein [Archangium gephyra]AKI99760.1 Hypothetical protein AA314_01387 [Archangium gephyra]REG27709.1 hypothetical protein ATI61_10944 [Archangium gephyra]
MNSPSLFRAVAAAGLSLAVVACGPQEELSSPELNPATLETPLAGPRLSPVEARAAAAAAISGVITTDEVLGISYVRPHGVRPTLVADEVPAYAVSVTWSGGDGVLVRELVYVDVHDGAVLLRVPLEERPALAN